MEYIYYILEQRCFVFPKFFVFKSSVSKDNFA